MFLRHLPPVHAFKLLIILFSVLDFIRLFSKFSASLTLSVPHFFSFHRRHCRTTVNIFHHAAAAGTILFVTHNNTGPQRRQTGRYVHSILVIIIYSGCRYYSHSTASHSSGEWTATFTDCAPCNPLTNGYVRVLT